MAADAIVPDTKDWTWVLERPCPQCGFKAASVARAQVAGLIRANAGGWPGVLARPSVAIRPEPGVWSPLEYACHVRDVHRLFSQRLALMLAEDNPTFPNWDQDATAVAERYHLQDPAHVSGELEAAASEVASAYDRVSDGQWSRPGTRSNGSTFTVESLARYHLHDVVHHLVDVAG